MIDGEINMNKQRESQIREMIKEVKKVKNNIESILMDEEYFFDNMPENLQGSDRGIRSEDCIDSLNDAIQSIGECIESLEEI